ncbi:LysR family transcriptional regulator [Vibrio sp. SCSIO 43136]|uniref:LysR family transcriptional regulator n=1 Tax=Vibrio sp. SCSIO 43136 TaxID=2819101 RepID=UPI002075512E|nr:LysR family transcriptional regulator [Vibrio sp. SCSIO 43136]USD64317.1 LysR family transcriptional regulator [Vibrio sp. SCSIO 43136]
MANWEGVTEFVAVADTHSFTQAAKRLNTSVAQVSRRVAILEERLAVKLLHRTTRKVSLTEAGGLYYQHCRSLVEGLENAELAVTQMQTEPKGLVKVTAPVAYGESHIVPLLNEFLATYPQVDLDLHLSNQKMDLIEAGFDVAIRLGRLEDSSLIAKRLASRQLYVCATSDYLAQYGLPQNPSELEQHNCLVGSSRYWHFRGDKPIRVSGRVHCNSGFALVDAAKRHLGMIQLPEYYVREALDSGALIEVLSEFRPEKEGIWALYPQNRHLSPKVRLLIDYLAEKLGH